VKYRVTILPRAKRQLLEQAIWWSENRSADQAYFWLEGFEMALTSLADHPQRFSTARESNAFDFVVRDLHYGLRSKATHRAVFEIHDDEVIVHSVRHLAQSDLTPEDIE
jgi:plasmid stabilization system protein ParE